MPISNYSILKTEFPNTARKSFLLEQFVPMALVTTYCLKPTMTNHILKSKYYLEHIYWNCLLIAFVLMLIAQALHCAWNLVPFLSHFLYKLAIVVIVKQYIRTLEFKCTKHASNLPSNKTEGTREISGPAFGGEQFCLKSMHTLYTQTMLTVTNTSQ